LDKDRRKSMRNFSIVVFLLGIFRRPGGVLVPFSFPGGALPLKKNKKF
jgi:hypothetical protein